LTKGFAKSRFSYILKSYLKRWIRLGSHLIFQRSIYRIPLDKWYDWPMDLMFYVMDVLLISDIADLLMNGFRKMRGLSENEIVIAKEIFRNNLDLGQVFIFEKAKPLKKGLYHAFVSFNTIQSIKALSLPILVHELVHVWQYQRFGSVYIYRALKAQNSKAGYNYGGCDNLISCLEAGTNYISFNFEQQAEIIEDYIKMQLSNQRLNLDLAIYSAFVEQLDYSQA